MLLDDEVLARFEKKSPFTVMTRATMERALCEADLDRLFDQVADRQYTRTLLFSSLVQVMSLVVLNKLSVRKAVSKHPEIAVTLQAVYDKLDRLEPKTARMLVTYVAARLSAVVAQAGAAAPEWLPGYRAKVMDGNHLAATEHRLQVLRDTAAGALPGFGVVVYDPRLEMVIDYFPEEDGHAQERSLTGQILATVQEKDLWIDDRNFCTVPLLAGIAQRGAFFVTRKHANSPWEPTGPATRCGENETGVVYEQPGILRGQFGNLPVRLVSVRLFEQTRGGDAEIRILTNLPGPDLAGGVTAMAVAELYRHRWSIEAAFGEMARALAGEVPALGYPKAALFAFAVALCAYNLFATLKAALRAAHGDETVKNEVSGILIAGDVALDYHGMEIAIPDEAWKRFAEMPLAAFADWLVKLAKKVDLNSVKKAKRGPKKPKVKPKLDPKHPHVSTARLLAARLAARRKGK